MVKRIVVANSKGGVAKTTTAVAVAHGLALRGANVVLVDLDPQGHDATSLGMDPEPGVFDYLVSLAPVANVVRETGRLGLALLPGNSRTRTAQTVLQVEGGVHGVTQRLEALGEGRDFVVFDTPPSGLFQEMAIALADMLIIPARLESLVLTEVANTLAIARRIGQGAEYMILPTAQDRRLAEHRANLQALMADYPLRVALPIPQRVAVAEAAAMGQTIWEYAGEGIVVVRAAYEALLALVCGRAFSQENLMGWLGPGPGREASDGH